jgi:biopolymer transport protein ExbD/biopolymer transport protein TolR
MDRSLAAWFVSLTVAVIPGAALAQQQPPLQRGVSVQMVVTRNAVAVPNADTQDALVVALTADGSAYLRGDRLAMPALTDAIRRALSTRNDKTLYIKADARVPYAALIGVIDSLQRSGIDGLTLLTTQQDAGDRGARVVSPKGLEMRVVTQR